MQIKDAVSQFQGASGCIVITTDLKKTFSYEISESDGNVYLPSEVGSKKKVGGCFHLRFAKPWRQWVDGSVDL